MSLSLPLRKMNTNIEARSSERFIRVRVKPERKFLLRLDHEVSRSPDEEMVDLLTVLRVEGIQYL